MTYSSSCMCTDTTLTHTRLKLQVLWYCVHGINLIKCYCLGCHIDIIFIHDQVWYWKLRVSIDLTSRIQSDTLLFFFLSFFRSVHPISMGTAWVSKQLRCFSCFSVISSCQICKMQPLKTDFHTSNCIGLQTSKYPFVSHTLPSRGLRLGPCQIPEQSTVHDSSESCPSQCYMS